MMTHHLATLPVAIAITAKEANKDIRPTYIRLLRLHRPYQQWLLLCHKNPNTMVEMKTSTINDSNG